MPFRGCFKPSFNFKNIEVLSSPATPNEFITVPTESIVLNNPQKVPSKPRNTSKPIKYLEISLVSSSLKFKLSNNDLIANEEIVNLPLCSTNILAIGASKINFLVLIFAVKSFDLFLLYPSIHSISGIKVYTCLKIIMIPKAKTEKIKPLIIGLVKNELIKLLIRKKPNTRFKIIKTIIR